jgi:hypothetical protein
MRIQKRLHNPQARLRPHGREPVGIPRNLLSRPFVFHGHLDYFDNSGNKKTLSRSGREWSIVLFA